MKFVPNGSIIKFLLIAVLGCGLAFLMAWLTTMFTVIKITQGVSLAGVALILLWCVVIGGAAVWSICAFCALYVGTWRKHHVDHAIRLSEAMLMLHASTNHEQLEALRHYRIRVFKSHEAIPAGGKLGVDCREVSNFLSPMLFGFNKFFALGSPEYCCDATQLSAIVEENQTRWCGESSVAPSCDAAKLRACLETSAFIVTRRHVDKKRLCAVAKTREDCQTVPQRSDGQRMGACTSSPAPCFWRRSEAQNRPA